MKFKSKTVFVGLIAAAVILSGCAKTKEIRVSEDVKKDVELKSGDNKPKTEPILKGSLNGLENQDILFWIDDENILTTEQTEEKLVLYNYNLENKKSMEILNDNNIKIIYHSNNEEGLVLLGNEKEVFVYDAKERKLEKVLDIEKEFKIGVIGDIKIQLVKNGYIIYSSKVISENAAEYTILNYKDNIKKTIELSRLYGKTCGVGKNVYTAQTNELTKINLETGEKSSMKLISPSIENVFEDGTLLVNYKEEGEEYTVKPKKYRIDFDNKKVTRYDENYEGKNFEIVSIDLKNEFVNYVSLENYDKIIAMYGKIEANKFIVTDKLFKNNEEDGCNTVGQYIFSPDHNKFITNVATSKEKLDGTGNYESKNIKYLFELK